ncbi:MAG TPA: hypothetical protein VGI93_13925 [Steroidobacteraceae bacterium]
MMKTALPLLALSLVAGLVHAEDYLSPSEERVRLSLGFDHYSSDTNIRIDGSSNIPGTPLNAEDVLGLEKSDFLPKFQAMLRVGERNRVWFDYFSLDRNGNATLTQPYIFRDVVLQTGDPVQSDLSMRVLGLTYGYSFIHREHLELAATLGINETDISARARVQTATRHVDQTEDAAGPIPVLGLAGTWVISKRFYLDGSARYVKVNIDSLSGTLGLYEADVLYRLRPNISFAMGYSFNKADIDSRKSGKSGVFDFDSKGPEFLIRIAF